MMSLQGYLEWSEWFKLRTLPWMSDSIVLITFFRYSICDLSTEIELSILSLAFTLAVNWFDISSIEAEFLLIFDLKDARSSRLTMRLNGPNNQAQEYLSTISSKRSDSNSRYSFSFLKFVILLRINLKKSVFTGKGKSPSTKFVFFYFNSEFPKLG